VLVAKAGHNAEPHNHNDVGSFVVHAGDVTYLCDPGSGLYQKSYFDSRRYECVFAGSQGHSVPLIDGRRQPAGKDYRGVMTQPAKKTVHIRFEEAYKVESLTKAERTFVMQSNGVITLKDHYAFMGEGLEVEEGFMTWLEVEVDGPVARITSDSGALELRADAGTFAVQRLEEECKANKKPGVLKRITLASPKAAEHRFRYTMTYAPKR